MPDNSFFELLRSVFGKIKTPFNKQQLLKDLEKFLLRDDIQKSIAAYIDDDDSKVIAAVALFGEPLSEELEQFFDGEFSSMQLQDIIVNLEERFILYRFKGDVQTSKGMIEKRLALNPVLETVLAPVVANFEKLFPVQKTVKNKATETKHAVVINDLLTAALLSFILQYNAVHKTAKSCFPGIDLEEAIGVLQLLGLFYKEENQILAHEKRFSEFALLSAQERNEYYTAALLVYKEENCPVNILAPYYKSQIQEAVNFVHAFSQEKIARQIEGAEKRLALIVKSRTKALLNIDLFSDVIKKIGLFASPRKETRHGIPITIDSGFSVIVYPEINFADAVKLASFLNIKEAGAVVRFELEKDSAVRAFDNGINADEIIDTLNRLTGKKISESLAWNLKDWEKRYGEVSLKKGIVLTLSQDKHYLIKTQPLASLICETLAPGVYLLSEDTAEEAATALRNAGIDVISQVVCPPGKTKKEFSASLQNYFSSPVTDVTQIIPTAAKSANKKGTNAEELTKNFLSVLEKLPLTKTDRDELGARINRRLVLCESQLKEADIRYEKLEARHMDFLGKQNIAKQAIAQKSPVEIELPGNVAVKGKNAKSLLQSGGNRFYGIPKELEKNGSELILVVVPAGKEEELRIPLAKISLLRRIKKSIFDG